VNHAEERQSSRQTKGRSKILMNVAGGIKGSSVMSKARMGRDDSMCSCNQACKFRSKGAFGACMNCSLLNVACIPSLSKAIKEF
jgi:hypothetical protein